MDHHPIENMHFVNALPPVADALAATAVSDVINMEGAHKCIFVVQKGVGTTGTSTITVEACDDATPSNATAIPFKYRNVVSGDTTTALTEATASGFATTAGSNHMIIVEVDASAVQAAASNAGRGYVRLKATEVVDSPVLAGILAILVPLRHSDYVGFTAIV